MKIEIKVTATELTPYDREVSKRYCAAFENLDGSCIAHAEYLTPIEDRIIESICARIRHDRTKLIKWQEDNNAVWATIEIIPAIDYEPE